MQLYAAKIGVFAMSMNRRQATAADPLAIFRTATRVLVVDSTRSAFDITHRSLDSQRE
jgi:hypothetical protein